MPNRKVEEILRNFRARFQPEGGPVIPMALRQESSDVVYMSLYEPKRDTMPSPMLGFEPNSGDEMMPAGDPGAMLDELLGASMGSGATPPPELLAEPGAGPQAPQAAPDLASMLGMM